ncbi:MAG: ribonuclease R [Chlorobiaceae bacterium]|nr:ribonuclease R [Chlorobiaceae bacterium]MBA4309872.1 ribonuclease R [Chlorobiaceae bacterium]
MKKEILAYFNKNTDGIKSRDLAKKLHLTNDFEFHSLKATLHNLCAEGFLIREGKRYRVNLGIVPKTITGKLEINRAGYGFVSWEDKKLKDIFIAERNLGTAFTGDTVEVSLFAKQKGKGKNFEGEVVRIISRKWKELAGTLQKSDSLYFVIPSSPEIHKDIYVSSKNLNGAKEGDRVIVGELIWLSPKLNPEGKIQKVIDKTKLFESELITIASEFNLPHKFSSKTISEAKKITEEIDENEIQKRIDFRSITTITIDPEDAKDFDDALSFEELENGNYRIGIHIADVSHYVKHNSALDKEAVERGNSVYLVGQVIPMLPENLSNNICSLVPYKDRLTYSVIIEITKKGKIVDQNISKTIINSNRRFSYEEVQKIIETGEGDFSKEILILNKLAILLRSKRMKEGSINFFSVEVKFVLDSNGKPIEIIRKESLESNNLIEEYMLLANQIVAQRIGKVRKKSDVKPFVYRIHDFPDKDKIAEFSRFVKTLGYNYSVEDSLDPRKLNQLMESVKGKEEEDVVNELAIRSMAKAIYSHQNIGHYGLGFKYYTHFTSPIRRYADLLVHRMLFDYLNSKQPKYSTESLEQLSEHISFCEKNAVDAERFSVKQKRIEYLQNHLGDEFDAIISGVMHFGIFVKIRDILAEGLIHVRSLENDFYVFDEKKYALIGRATKKSFRLGDKLRVKLVRIDEEKNEVDFIVSN